MTKTTNEARENFNDLGLSYSDVTKETIPMLEYYIADTLLKRMREGLKPSMSIDDKKDFKWSEDGTLIEGYLTTSSTWFQEREAISFNKDGFIGFAGWADDEHLDPFVTGFYRWAKFLAKTKQQ